MGNQIEKDEHGQIVEYHHPTKAIPKLGIQLHYADNHIKMWFNDVLIVDRKTEGNPPLYKEPIIDFTNVIRSAGGKGDLVVRGWNTEGRTVNPWHFKYALFQNSGALWYQEEKSDDGNVGLRYERTHQLDFT